LTGLQRAGTIRTVGSSTFEGWQLVHEQTVAERRGLGWIRTEQPPYSILARHAERDVFPVAEEYRLGVLVWAPLG
jgi:aryl-alcohol dehydrogenase-like predicted oxidoreductase